MTDPTNERKIQHIRIIGKDRDVDRRKYYFDAIHLAHRALPEIALDDVDSATTLMGKHLSFPLLISSMTGGDHGLVRTINSNLAVAAEKTRVAMGVGSQRVMFSSPEARNSFAIRPLAPHALLFANLGAVQLNHGFDADNCKEAVEVLGADGLYFHLNPLQEAVQPEGDTNFAGLADKLIAVAERLDVPVILKEIGCGISPADVERFRGSKVRHIDVAGSGGTSWSRIENHRDANPEQDLGIAFQDWGIPTPLALQMLAPYRNDFTLFASAGIRSGIDMAKAMVLGARLSGLASPFLKPAMESADAVISVIERLRREFVAAMFLMGVKSVEDLTGNSELILA